MDILSSEIVHTLLVVLQQKNISDCYHTVWYFYTEKYTLIHLIFAQLQISRIFFRALNFRAPRFRAHLFFAHPFKGKLKIKASSGLNDIFRKHNVTGNDRFVCGIEAHMTRQQMTM